jgi:hypothetical protein
MIGLLSFLGSWGDGTAAPAPEVVSELEAIEQSFCVDNRPMRLMPHELMQLKRIRALAQRDKKRAMLALRILGKQATEARRGMRMGRLPA